MHKFEFPYSFSDTTFFPRLELNLDYKDYIKFVYIPSWNRDSLCSRSKFIFIPDEWNEYKSHIVKLKSYGIEPCILFQENINDIDIVKKYIDELGIKYFTLNNDDLAEKLKLIYGNDIYLTLSITRVIKKSELMIESNFSMYDCIVLYFWFNRNLDSIKELPNRSYCIIVNNTCYYNCPWSRSHWFDLTGTFDEFTHCGKFIRDNNGNIVMKNITYIKPEDLHYFDPYIDTYKIVDRLHPSIQNFNALHDYINRKSRTSPYSLLTWEEDKENNYYGNI